MTALDPALRELRDLCRQIAPDLRSRALAVDAEPLDLDRHLDSPTLRLLRSASTPKRFRDQDVPLDVAEYTDSCLARVVANFELARGGDAGALSANTGPSFAGLAVDALGDEAQQELFYRAVADGRSWTFFAMTEPERGSDATAMQTSLAADPGADPADGRRLNGTKRYVANASRGAIGVVFARVGPTPLAIRAALVQRPAPGLTGQALPMIGLRGACIGQLDFEDVHVPRELLLGSHLPMSRRGLWGAGRAFNVMRTQIAALAVGTGFAALDYVAQQRPGWSGGELVSARLRAAEALLYDAAAEVDRSPDDRRAPSVAKLHATDLAVQVTRWAEYALGPGSLLEHPLLEKWSRDVCAFEFMDGTSNILRTHIAPAAATVGMWA
jgi:alkylation response protein AidB-like acyl-CoA dehydrogenase